MPSPTSATTSGRRSGTGNSAISGANAATAKMISSGFAEESLTADAVCRSSSGRDHAPEDHRRSIYNLTTEGTEATEESQSGDADRSVAELLCGSSVASVPSVVKGPLPRGFATKRTRYR